MESARLLSSHGYEAKQSQENVREMEQIRHTNDTLQKEFPSDSYRAQTEASNIRVVTPIYKTGEKPGSDIKLGVHPEELSSRFASSNGDYKAERSQEHFRMQIIDPKVVDNAHIPASIINVERKTRVGDFPSQHGKRSLLNLDAMEQLKRRSTEKRPITTSTYLTESLNRHRDMEASKLKEYLRARENDANKPWDKANWPGPKAATEPKKPWPHMPALRPVADSPQSTLTRQFDESYARRVNRYNSMPALDIGSSGGTLIRLKDEKPRSIMKRSQLDSREQILVPERRVYEVRQEVVKPKVTQTVQKFEENKRTEEVERRIIRRERRHKSHRSSHRYGGGQEALEWHSSGGGGGGGYRSTSASRAGYANGFGGNYQDSNYHRSTSSRREGGGSAFGGNDRYYDHYSPNGEFRESYYRNGGGNGRVHKSYSTKDVFNNNNNNYDDHYSSSFGQQRRGAPFIEFPPTLPRHAERPAPPPHRGFANGNNANDSFYRPIAKSRSYADWDEGRGPFGNSVRRYEDDMTRLENEFRDSRLLHIPNGNLNEKDYRHEQIPGGYETYNRETKANAGSRLNRNGNPADFKEHSQEYSYKREQTHQ